MVPKCIAVATDFSPRADRAIDRAKLLQQHMQAKLCAIHATNLAADDPPDLGELNRKMLASTGLTAEKGRTEFLYPAGSPPHAIASACNKSGADLLLLGPARYNTLGDFFLGTAVDYILRTTSKPTLIVKNRAHTDYQQIIAGTDFSPGSANAILTAADMFPDASIHITHAWQVPFQAFNTDAYVAEELEAEHTATMGKFMVELTARNGRFGDATSEVVRGDATDAIRKALALTPDAMVVVGSHGTSGFKQATIGSVTSELLRYLEADTLVVNAAAAG
ncbi:MAG: universal stress protein [Pseudomonadota bacterium]